MDTNTDRRPTDDEAAGMAWWNGLTETARTYWLQRVAAEAEPGVNPSVADAWIARKKQAANIVRIDRLMRAIAACPDDTTPGAW